MKKEKRSYFLAITVIITLIVTCALGLIYDFFNINNYWLTGSILIVQICGTVVFYCNLKSQKINEVISVIGTITDSPNYANFCRIEEARRKYDLLSPKEKRKVINYSLLIDAEISRKYILKIWEMEKSTSIPNITEIQNLTDNYNRLTTEQKSRIKNISVIYTFTRACNITQRIDCEYNKFRSEGINYFTNENLNILQRLRDDFETLPANLQFKVANYDLLLSIEAEKEKHKECEKQVAELIDKIEDIESIFHEEKSAKVWNIDPDTLFFNTLMNAQELYDSLAPNYQNKVTNFSSMAHMLDLIQKKMGNKENQDFNMNKLRVLCPKRELKKLDGQKEQLMHALTRYCEEFSRHDQKKYKDEFDHWINYFMNIHLDYLPVNPNSFLFALTIGEYYYHVEHSPQSALRWFEKARGFFESEQWDLSNYAKKASVMYKVMADIIDDEDVKLLYYKMSFFCDIDNKEIYGILMEKDPENRRMYLQYKNKRSPFNWENIKNVGSMIEKIMSSNTVEKITDIAGMFVSN